MVSPSLLSQAAQPAPSPVPSDSLGYPADAKFRVKVTRYGGGSPLYLGGWDLYFKARTLRDTLNSIYRVSGSKFAEVVDRGGRPVDEYGDPLPARRLCDDCPLSLLPEESRYCAGCAARRAVVRRSAAVARAITGKGVVR